MNLSFEAERAVKLGREEAEKRGHLLCLGEHLAHALLAGELRSSLGELRRKKLIDALEAYLGKLPAMRRSLPPVWSGDLEAIRATAEGAALRRGATAIEPADLWLGFVESARGRELLRASDIDPQAVISTAPREAARAEVTAGESAAVVQKGDGGDVLARFGRDLNEAAAAGKMDPVAGRDAEIDRVIEVFLRRSKRNPLLVGHPGTGKTAIVEGVAQRIVAERVPEQLRGVRIVEISLSSMIAGAKYRGELEERLEGVIARAREEAGCMILFFDEIHTLVGTGGGNLDAGNILKPALGRGEILCIGATTLEEYRTKLQADEALERRFTKIDVDEPDDPRAVAMMRTLRPRLEAHFGLRIPDEALDAAVLLGRRYIWAQYLPDKARDLLEWSGAHLRYEIDAGPEHIRKLEAQLLEHTACGREVEAADVTRELEPLRKRWKEEQTLGKAMAELRKERVVLEAARDQAQRTGDVPAIAAALDKLESVRARLLTAEAQLAEQRRGAGFVSWEINAEEIAKTIQRRTGIPVGTIVRGERERIAGLRAALASEVLGQEEAVATVASALERSRVGLNAPGHPVASFLLVGPTGVGKTHLGRTIARELFGREDALIRIDMGEYHDASSFTRLVGTSPGYVGYEKGGQLTEAIARQPYSVVLFDEMEKAHPDILQRLLQLTGEAKLTDGQGTTYDFQNALLLFTSNLAAAEIEEELERRASWTAGERQALYERALKTLLKREFLGRLEVVVFNGLSKTALSALVERELRLLSERLAATQGMRLEWSPGLVDRVTALYDATFGARSITSVIRNEIERPLARMILSSADPRGCVVRVEAAESSAARLELRCEERGTI